LNENEQSTKQSIIDESINNELNKHYQNVNEDRLMIIIQPVELRASSTKMGGGRELVANVQRTSTIYL